MKQGEKKEFFVPGRLCLFGEHSDWAGTNKTMNADIVPGRAIVTGIEQGIYATAEKDSLFSVYSSLPQYSSSSFECPMDTDLLRQVAHNGGYFSYVAGVASYICEWYHVSGARIEITSMDLPMKKGLSSSAAICVLVAEVFNELYSLHLNTMGLMNIAYWGEQRTPSRCGRLDQACAFGTRPVVMNFDGNEITTKQISLKKPLYYVFADLMAGKNTVKILADLNSAYPFPKTETEQRLHEALGKDNQYITECAIQYMTEGNVEQLGALMQKAQELFDEKVAPMSPSELAAPILHSVINDATVQSLTYGVKGVGSQGDGTVQLLAKDQLSQQKLLDYLRNNRKMISYPLTLKPRTLVRKAVIPVAGFGTRLYPETRFIKKEFCPLVDSDGFVKPLLLVLLEELDAIGIEEICLVLNPEEKDLYDRLLFTPLSENHYSKLSPAMKTYENKFLRISKKITYVFQNEPKGFGHAVFQTKQFSNNEPILLLLGDTIYHSNSSIPCTRQLLNAYELYGLTTVAVHNVPINTVGSFGIFSGVWENQEENIFRCTKIVEKPNEVTAREFLNVPSKKSPVNYFGAFGAYVLTSEVYDRLEYAVDNNLVNNRGEIELTDALAFLGESGKVLGFVVDGKSFDLGNAEAYRKTVSKFGLF